jgi:hypothetical protein
MKTRISFFALLLGVLSISFFPACNKSNSGNSVTTVGPVTLAGNWAAKVFINTTNGHRDTAIATGLIDTLQFTSTGQLNAAYYVQTFDTLTSHVVYVRTVDSASYSFVNDSTIHITGKTNLYLANNSADVFVIHYLDAQQLQLYAPDQGGSGGYLYVYSKF